MNKSNHNKPTYVVGYTFTNNQGFNATVIEYKGRKNIDIQFEDGCIVRKTTGSYIAKGFPLHPTYGKVKVGDTFACKCGDTVEVLEYVSSTKIKVKWLSDGCEKWTSSETLKLGINKNPNSFYAKGDIVQTNNFGQVEVMEYRSATDIIVKFEDGKLKSTSANSLSKGNVRPPDAFKDRNGSVFTTNSGWSCTVIKYASASHVEVVWQDGSESVERWCNLKNGTVKPLLQPSVAGVGFVGEGRFVNSTYKFLPEGKEYIHPRIYAYWQRMINRCYNEKEQMKPSSKAYIDCSVDESWKNMQNFAEWAYKKKQTWLKEGEFIWELDKDCLIKGNRIYSESTCTFLPPEINIVLADSPRPKGLPRGVNYIKPATSGAKEGYIARCHIQGERKYLGYYDDEMRTSRVYKKFKEAYIKELAEKYKDNLEIEAYNALINLTIDPYD